MPPEKQEQQPPPEIPPAFADLVRQPQQQEPSVQKPIDPWHEWCQKVADGEISIPTKVLSVRDLSEVTAEAVQGDVDALLQELAR